MIQFPKQMKNSTTVLVITIVVLFSSFSISQSFSSKSHSVRNFYKLCHSSCDYTPVVSLQATSTVNNKQKNCDNIRRSIILQIGGMAVFNQKALASETHQDEELPSKSSSRKKPFAPNEALIPAARVKLNIDKAIILSRQIIANSSPQGLETIIGELQDLILKPQNYLGDLQIQDVPDAPSKLYTENYKTMKGDLPFQSYLIKNGDVGTWKNLKQKEKLNEKANELRAAFNFYTDALSFSGQNYVLNVDSQTKKDMVRNEKLPDLKQVITSDMGMRYLYRNQILTAMDDVQAELQYQSSEYSTSKSFDASDLLDLLLLASQATDKWFSLIDPEDVALAFETITNKQ